MKLSKKQKKLVVIFSFFCVILICDRLFMIPHSSQAQNNNTAGSQATELVLEVGDLSDIQSRAGRITQRLDTLWPDGHQDSRDAREAFMLPSSWPISNDSKTSTKAVHPGSDFIRQHQLKAVILDGQQSRVVIDDHVLVLGQSLEGFTLVAVHDGSATFESDQVRFVMHLANDR